jgi:hypothetical protein
MSSQAKMELYSEGGYMDSNPKEVKESVEQVTTEVETVSKKAYLETKDDMIKYKSRMKELENKLNQLQADRESEEKSKMLEQEKWQDLFKVTEGKLNQVLKERDEQQQLFVSSHKANAVIQQLGGFKKPEYNKFIDLNNVSVNDDGSIDFSSVEKEVSRIKIEYPELIKSNEVAKPISNSPKPVIGIEKSYKDLSAQDQYEYKRKLLQEIK